MVLCYLEHGTSADSHIVGYRIDSCCIDKTNLAETSEAINSMYRWYSRAETCIIYLSDFRYLGDFSSEQHTYNLTRSEWFTRGWTLQELVAPAHAVFFDQYWNRFRSKSDILSDLVKYTGIAESVLRDPVNIRGVSIAHRMSWASQRKTHKEEDIAYCLMGIFGVNMPILYGEGVESAFRRLQEQIISLSDDNSIFAWRHPSQNIGQTGLLAPSPECFGQAREFYPGRAESSRKPYHMTNKGLAVQFPTLAIPDENVFVAMLNCRMDKDHNVGIFLACIDEDLGQYRRIRSNETCRIYIAGQGPPKDMYVKQNFDI